MNVINRAAIEKARHDHPNCRDWLAGWWRVARAAQWTCLADVRRAYASADHVGGCLVFDAPEAKRLIVGVYFAHSNRMRTGTLYFKHFLTHAEYDRNRWKKDC